MHSPLLTEAFHDPQLLYRESPSLAFGDFRPTPYKKVTDTLEGHQVIVVRRIIDKFKIAWLLVSFLILSPCLGIVVGTCSHNADVGVAVSAGVFALASFVQGLIAWVQR